MGHLSKENSAHDLFSLQIRLVYLLETNLLVIKIKEKVCIQLLLCSLSCSTFMSCEPIDLLSVECVLQLSFSALDVVLQIQCVMLSRQLRLYDSSFETH